MDILRIMLMILLEIMDFVYSKLTNEFKIEFINKTSYL